MTRIKQKAIEYENLVLFLKSKSWFENFEIKESECPDFILTEKATNINIALEITEFFNDYSKKGSNDQREYNHLSNVTDQTRKYIKEKFKNKKLKFYLTYKLTNDKSIDFNFNMIKKYLDEFYSSDLKKNTIVINSKNLEKIVIEESNLEPEFCTLAVTGNNPIDENTLKKHIVDKIIKQKKWKGNFNEKWLLIHTGNGFSNNFNKPKKLETNFCEFKSNWDKIFLMFPTKNGESIELSTT